MMEGSGVSWGARGSSISGGTRNSVIVAERRASRTQQAGFEPRDAGLFITKAPESQCLLFIFVNGRRSHPATVEAPSGDRCRS